MGSKPEVATFYIEVIAFLPDISTGIGRLIDICQSILTKRILLYTKMKKNLRNFIYNYI